LASAESATLEGHDGQIDRPVTSAGTALLVFCRMKGGFGPYNLRAFGITLVATFATLLALRSESTLLAAMGILGAIAGYLFSVKSDKGDPAPGANTTGTTLP
jgi:hypothetical protein